MVKCVTNFQQVYHKNWRQITSISPGIILLLCSGVHVLNVLLELRYHVLNPNERNWISVFIHSSWFYGAPIGFILSAVDTQKLRKRNIYILSSLLLLISSILLLTSNAKFVSPIVGRFLAGVTHGLVLHTVLIHSGEMGIRKTRQFIIRPLGFAIIIGMALHYSIKELLHMQNDQFILPGTLSLILSTIALVFSFCFTYESVPWLIRCGNNVTLALQTWLVIQGEPNAATASHLVREFDDLRFNIETSDNLSANVLTNGNAIALIKCSSVRILSAVAISPMTFVLITLEENNDTFDVFLSVLARVLFAIIFLYFQFDRISKDADCILCIILFGIEIILTNICFVFQLKYWLIDLLWYCMLVTFLIAPTILDFVSYVYLSELFPFRKKDWSIAIVLILEYLVHILLIGFCTFVPLQYRHITLLGIGGIITALAVVIYCTVNVYDLLMLREDRHAALPRRDSASIRV